MYAMSPYGASRVRCPFYPIGVGMPVVSRKTRSVMKSRLSEQHPYGWGRRKSPFPPVMGGTDGYGWFGPEVISRVDAAAWYVMSRLSEMPGYNLKRGMCRNCVHILDMYRLAQFAAIDQMGQEASIVRIDRLITNSRYWDLWVSLIRKQMCVPTGHECPMRGVMGYERY